MNGSPRPLPEFTTWPTFPFEGTLRLRELAEPETFEPPREGEDGQPCPSCAAPDSAYIWVNERWRVKSLARPSGLPMVLMLETRSHLDLGDLPNLLAAELGVMTVRLEKAIRSLDGVARVHVNRWGDGLAHLHVWFFARPYGRTQLRGSFLPMWNDILPPVDEVRWREDQALVAAWLAEFGGEAIAEPPRIQWLSPSRLEESDSPADAGGYGSASPLDDGANPLAFDSAASPHDSAAPTTAGRTAETGPAGGATGTGEREKPVSGRT